MELIILIGLQGAGKSTFYQQYFRDTHLRLNGDMLKTKHREQILFQACLASKTNMVIDKINISQLHRVDYIQQAKQQHFKVIAYYFDVTVDDAVIRNEQRQGKAKIPIVGIKNSAKLLERPDYSEGFDTIYHVQVINQQFVIKEIVKI